MSKANLLILIKRLQIICFLTNYLQSKIIILNEILPTLFHIHIYSIAGAGQPPHNLHDSGVVLYQLHLGKAATS